MRCTERASPPRQDSSSGGRSSLDAAVSQLVINSCRRPAMLMRFFSDADGGHSHAASQILVLVSDGR
jgi:hypothetical protein